MSVYAFRICKESSVVQYYQIPRGDEIRTYKVTQRGLRDVSEFFDAGMGFNFFDGHCQYKKLNHEDSRRILSELEEMSSLSRAS